MNNFYALIYLTKYLKNNCRSFVFQFSYSPHKDVWEGYVVHQNERKRIVFSANPAETALFADKDRPPKKSNVTHFFPDLEQKKISDINLAENDRYLTIHFENGLSLIFQLFGNKPNIFLVKKNEIIESFKGTQEYIGKPAPRPRAPSIPGELKESLSPKQTVIKTDPAFPRHLVQPVTDHFSLDKKSSAEIKDIVQHVTKAMKERPEFRVLEDGNLCLVPSDLLPVKNLKVFDNVNDAIRFAYYRTSRERRLSSKIQSIKPKIDNALRQRESTIGQLKQAEKGLERAKQYEEYGHILMAHAHEKTDEGTGKITLSNFYQDNEPVEISIKPELSIAENAQRYYEKSTKAIRNVKESKRRLKEMKDEKDRLDRLQKSFSSIEKVYEFDDWFEEHETDLKELGILAKTQQKETLPYRKIMIDRYEVWIGKNAKSNDRLTSDAHKEDIWLHARGVSGSHVVIRMNNNKELPPKTVILKAAAVAAWNSKSRGSQLAPVIFTKRKYITKPKGSPPGAVRVQHENVEMVQPQKISS
ncbi:MAG: NFACT RNA binding domain-containing protein [Balneolaceae bacterium]